MYNALFKILPILFHLNVKSFSVKKIISTEKPSLILEPEQYFTTNDLKMSNISVKNKNKGFVSPCVGLVLTLFIVILSRKKRSGFAYHGPLGNSEFQLNFIGISGALAFLFRHIVNIT